MPNTITFKYSPYDQTIYMGPQGNTSAQGVPDDESKMSFHLDPDVKKMIDETYFSGVLGFVRRLISSIFYVRWSIKLVDSNNDESKKIIDIALKTSGNREPILKNIMKVRLRLPRWEAMYGNF